MKYKIFFIIAGILINFSIQAQFVSHTYKVKDTVSLDLNIYYPHGEIPSKPLPAIVFYFGGGWVSGNPGHFAGQCEYLSSKGIIAIAADYRTRQRHGTTPLECIADAKSAIRWIRSNSQKLGIDPNKLAAAGGSAGGHLAASCAVVKGFDDQNDDLSISCVPNLLVLFNPAVNTWKGGIGSNRLGEHAKAVSPLHQLKPGIPPTLIFHGTNDNTVSIEDVREFKKKAQANGDECTLMEFDGRGHGFFNKRGDNTEDYWTTLKETEKFLRDRKFLKSE
jgi:acetyl esterase/lipase